MNPTVPQMSPNTNETKNMVPK